MTIVAVGVVAQDATPFFFCDFQKFADFSRGQFWPKFLLNAAEMRIWENWKHGPPFKNRVAQKESFELLKRDSVPQFI